VVTGGDQRVLATSMDGHLYVLDLTRGTQLSRIHLGPLPSSPAVGSDCVVIATAPGEVYCLGAKK
jgi:outer membrane protein assembly factor BamB